MPGGPRVRPCGRAGGCGTRAREADRQAAGEQPVGAVTAAGMVGHELAGQCRPKQRRRRRGQVPLRGPRRRPRDSHPRQCPKPTLVAQRDRQAAAPLGPRQRSHVEQARVQPVSQVGQRGHWNQEAPGTEPQHHQRPGQRTARGTLDRRGVHAAAQADQDAVTVDHQQRGCRPGAAPPGRSSRAGERGARCRGEASDRCRSRRCRRSRCGGRAGGGGHGCTGHQGDGKAGREHGPDEQMKTHACLREVSPAPGWPRPGGPAHGRARCAGDVAAPPARGAGVAGL